MLPNDRFGYSVYAPVVHASPQQVRMVAGVREAVGQAGTVIPAHVTARATSYGIERPEGVRGLLRRQPHDTQVELSLYGWSCPRTTMRVTAV
jgi:hypothetical protein